LLGLRSSARIEEPWTVRILVVEDDLAMKDLLIKLFTSEGFTVSGASSGSEAMQMFAHAEIDLLVSDIRMSTMNGLALASHVRECTPTTKILLITAYGERADGRKARAAGADAYMSKPFSLADLLATVRALVAGERG
jgi:DNA-binding response OmpR family regulator